MRPSLYNIDSPVKLLEGFRLARINSGNGWRQSPKGLWVLLRHPVVAGHENPVT